MVNEVGKEIVIHRHQWSLCSEYVNVFDNTAPPTRLISTCLINFWAAHCIVLIVRMWQFGPHFNCITSLSTHAICSAHRTDGQSMDLPTPVPQKHHSSPSLPKLLDGGWQTAKFGTVSFSCPHLGKESGLNYFILLRCLLIPPCPVMRCLGAQQFCSLFCCRWGKCLSKWGIWVKHRPPLKSRLRTA